MILKLEFPSLSNIRLVKLFTSTMNGLLLFIAYFSILAIDSSFGQQGNVNELISFILQSLSNSWDSFLLVFKFSFYFIIEANLFEKEGKVKVSRQAIDNFDYEVQDDPEKNNTAVAGLQG